jgi:ABC-type transport system substrate-binding protein
MPAISAGGRTYTFTVRPGFRFSPPSNEQVTAATFKHAIERALNPRMQAPYARLLGDVVGAQAYVAGKARHISGIVARGRSLTIRLVHAVGDLPARLSMPTFCAVPLDAPADPKGVSNLPAAGPYYVASHTPGAQIVLKRNPNYRGERPHRLAELDYMIGVGQQQAFREVLSGKADYAADGIPPEETAHARARYGPGSPPARAGRQQYFTNPLLTVRYLLLNPDRPLFADARLRRAVNYAIDRRALVAELRRLFGSGLSGGGRSTDQYLPPGMAGYSATPLYPLAGPDLSRARGLAGGHRRTAVLFACNTPPCPQIAQIVRKNLARIGIDVQIRAMPKAVMFARAAAPHPGYDLLLFGWAADYPDPANFLVPLFSRTLATAAGVGQFTRFDDPAYNRALARASGLTGAKRARVYAQLARSLARDAAPAVAYENDESRDFFSARIGCQIFQPIYGMDIGALCLRRPSPRAAPAAAP